MVLILYICICDKIVYICIKSEFVFCIYVIYLYIVLYNINFGNVLDQWILI